MRIIYYALDDSTIKDINAQQFEYTVKIIKAIKMVSDSTLRVAKNLWDVVKIGGTAEIRIPDGYVEHNSVRFDEGVRNLLQHGRLSNGDTAKFRPEMHLPVLEEQLKMAIVSDDYLSEQAIRSAINMFNEFSA
jgi:hypothetical protein